MVIFKPHWPNVNVPTDLGLYEFVVNRPWRPAPQHTNLFIDGNTGETVTRARLEQCSKKVAQVLVDKFNFKEQDVICIFSPNNIDYGSIVFGGFAAGGVLTTANPAYNEKEFTHQLKDSGAKYIFTTKELLPVATASAKTASIPDDHIFIFEKVPAQHGGKTYQPWADVFLTGTKEYTPKPTVGDNRKTLAFLVYSSGTTGLPKGVMLSHHNIIANLLQINMADGHFTKPTDVHLGFLPFYHIYGLTLILQTGIWCNTPTVVMPRFDMEQFLTLVQRYRVTLVNLVPPVALGLAKHPLVDKFDLSSIHYTNSGAAPLGAEIVEAVYKRTGVLVKQGYGLSETSPTTVAQPRYPGGWNELKEHMGSIGYLKSNLEAKVIDLEGKDLGYDQPGELCFRGPNIMMGYLNNKKATEDSIDKDGWFYTGDVAVVKKEKDGSEAFYIVDRVKELIKYKGFQVAPAELENVLCTHDDIADAGVTSVYDDSQATELPRAYVVLQGQAAQSVKPEDLNDSATTKKAEEIVKWVSGKVARHKQLRGGVVIIKEIPKSASGKILRRELKLRAKKEYESGGKSKL